MKEYRRGRTGFSLVELLVVIAIITILVSLLTPALFRAQFQGKNAMCKNNLRQVGIAMISYTGTYGAYPPVDSFSDVSGHLRYQWDQLLEPYLISQSPTPFNSGIGPASRHVNAFFLCPIFARQRSGMPFDHGYPLQMPLYGYNTLGVGEADTWPTRQSLGLAQLPLFDPQAPQRMLLSTIREDTVRVPSDMIGIGDPFVRAELPNQDGAFQYDWGWRPIRRKIFASSQMEQCTRANRSHGRSFNRWFCDGHVEAEDFKKPFAATDRDLQRWNSDNLPHRDRWYNVGGGR